MIVKEFIKLLQQESPDDLVVIAIDEEGNGFNPAYCITKNRYRDGETSIRELTPELKKRGFTKEDVFNGSDCKDCIVIWP